MAATEDPFGAASAPVYASGPSGPRAGFWPRFGAVLLDGILLSVIQFILVAALTTTGRILSLIVGIAYFVYFEGGATGQTLGKRALGIRVVDANTGGPIGYPRAFVRYVGRILSAIVIFIGYFWMIKDREKQTWHDKLAGDVVVPVTAYPTGPPAPPDPEYPSSAFGE
ncbi:MAG: RDD family protein [Actinobacteria bacterium]|nr:RDD family protein [Actinomycetota bacterium]